MSLRVLCLALLLATTPVGTAEPAEKAVPAPAKSVLTPAQKTAAYGALLALLKLEAATELRPDFARYEERLIDAKAQVRLQSPLLPEGAARLALTDALAAYGDAWSIWETCGRVGRWNAFKAMDEFKLLAKYHLEWRDVQGDDRIEGIFALAYVYPVWHIASEKLRLAEKAVTQG